METPEQTRVFGEPHETADGSTIVSATTVCASEVGYTATPLGVFVVRGDKVTWTAADASSRAALLGEFIGLVTGTILMLVLLRRPPWPDLSAKVMSVISRHHAE